MKKYFLYYSTGGFMAALWYANMVKFNLNLILGLVAVSGAFAALYFGKVADKVGAKNLLLIGIPILIVSIIFIANPVAQFFYGLVNTINLTAILIITSELKGGSGQNFGKLNFYSQMAFAVALLVGGLIQNIAVPISIVILILLELIILNGK